MNRIVLMAALLVAALPLAGCGNKGPLIRVPDVQGGPPEMPAESTSTMPVDSGSIVLPADNGTVMPPSASTVPDAAPDVAPDTGTEDGTPGTPR
jgi:predicted small lipoprotein YifL